MDKRVYKTMEYISFHDMTITDAVFKNHLLIIKFDGVFCFLENNNTKGVFVSNGEQKLVITVKKMLNWHDWENDLQDVNDFSSLNGKIFLALSCEEEKKAKLIYSIGEIDLEIEDIFAEILLTDLYWYRGLDDEERKNTDIPVSSLPVSYF
ncbi:hypothetical protein [Enterococcus sp. BWR-S5]|uniref:hypothetical protein n=1 Tax=Enterococcus sp. BWR-S5 TaxID=2787714 RepID=UPI0019234CF1|nr:hypothetical protein [Enterococcus sp. BWR-S5]MBL1224216.1 hypothetical protein [Enterococcus sp. BWR-S5]